MTEYRPLYTRGADRTLRRREDASRVVEELLLQCGITPHLSGFEPLSGGIRITAERERSHGRPPLAELQPAVGSLCGERSPEHAMRDAIGAGHLLSEEISTHLVSFPDRPSSAEFICTLAELVTDRIAQN